MSKHRFAPDTEQAGLILFCRGHKGRLYWRAIGASNQLAKEDIYRKHNRTKFWLCYPYHVSAGMKRYTYKKAREAAFFGQTQVIWKTLNADEKLYFIAQEEGRPILGQSIFFRWQKRRAGFGNLPFGSVDVPWSYWVNSKLPKKGFAKDVFGDTSFGSAKPINWIGYLAEESHSKSWCYRRGFALSEFGEKPFGSEYPFNTFFFGFGNPCPKLRRFGMGKPSFGFCSFGSPMP